MLTQRLEDLEEAIEGLLFQFAYQVEGPALATGGMSALQDGFEALGWGDPHPVPEIGCEYPGGCKQVATSGTPISPPLPDGTSYLRLCYEHFNLLSE